ncbi:MAG TPA: hypothetical protein VHG28_25240 [Longimicrobiaceae bacterium]|nr:hypothetical protein [Longimicrobiaceae bacterium]
MGPSSIRVSLKVGKTVPAAAPALLMNALQEVRVTYTDRGMAGGFQLTFSLQRGAGMASDYPLLSSPLLKPFNRVILSVTLNGTAQVLIDGMITNQQVTPAVGGSDGTLTVTGEDLSVLMDMLDLSMEYPAMGDYLIVLAVLAKYLVFGVIPEAIPPLSMPIADPLERVAQQDGTDLQYIRKLAGKYGYVFYLTPGPTEGASTAYWGPPFNPRRLLAPQKALSVDMGPATNVNSLNFTYDALQPTMVYGAVSDLLTEMIVPVVTFTSTRIPPMASEPALLFNQPYGRKELLRQEGMDALTALIQAQSITDQSTDQVVTASGEVDSLRYGAMLQPGRRVGVRGAGGSFDGDYYIQQVTHSLSLGQYKQSFSLSREGTGSLTSTVTP